MCRVVTILSLTQRSKLGGFSRYSSFFSFPGICSIWCVVQTKVLSKLGKPSGCLVHVSKVNKKLYRNIWKKVSHQKEVCQEKRKKSRFWKMKLQIKWDWNILTKPHFWDEIFFQRILQTFLWTLRTCSTYLKGPLKLIL